MEEEIDVPYQVIKYVVVLVAAAILILLFIFLGPEGTARHLSNALGFFTRPLASI